MRVNDVEVREVHRSHGLERDWARETHLALKDERDRPEPNGGGLVVGHRGGWREHRDRVASRLERPLEKVYRCDHAVGLRRVGVGEETDSHAVAGLSCRSALGIYLERHVSLRRTLDVRSCRHCRPAVFQSERVA